MIWELLGTAMHGRVICIFYMLAGPVFADTTAVYQTPARTSLMTVEIANNGDFRGELAGKPGYILFRDGVEYVVLSKATGVVVDRVEDLTSALDIVAEKRLDQTHLAERKSMASNTADVPKFLAKGDDIFVRGRKGTPYYFDRHLPRVIVMSSDPELALVGSAMAREIHIVDRLQAFDAHNPLISQLEEIMKTGAPLEFSGAELMPIAHDPIPPSLFDLPATPESREAIIKRIDATASARYISAF